MKVLSVSALLDPVSGGGTAERTIQLARAMARAGMQIRVLGMDVGGRNGAPDLGLAQLELVSAVNRRFMVPRVTTKRLADLVRWADVVHLCNHWTVLNLMVCKAAKCVGKPYAVCPAGALPLFGRSKWLKRGYNLVGGRALIADAAAWIAITRRETEDFRAYGIDPCDVDVIPNGIEPTEFSPGDGDAFRQKHRLGEGSVVLFMGRLNAIKGPDLLLEAFAREASALPGCVLVFAGPDGGMLSQLRRRTAIAGLADRVRFIGWVGGHDKVSAYRAASIVVVPSRQEAMSLVVLEAGASGKPVLMTDRCGFGEDEALGGPVAVPAEPSHLGSALREMLQSPLGERGARLRQLVLRRYTWDTAVQRHAALFTRMAVMQA